MGLDQNINFSFWVGGTHSVSDGLVSAFCPGILQPAAGTAIQGKDVVICKYPSDPTVVLGYLSAVFLILSTAFGLTSGLAAALLLWPTITEQLHLARKVHHNLDNDCPTTKTGLMGGGAFVSLDSCLFWLICLMLADNAREDYLDGIDDSRMGRCAQVVNIDYDPLNAARKI
ncbi:hypothetical protein Nepgr_001000 [Nepenthes gracilis]|uniref:Uncharacterized protein n=1 Tax=Nepenthes gracilis TaxID=150966 RepID=A0AAD3P458_NEPGR|nr:hypothetical protein Nepgr_001000 [Nepenthes gracilis]